MLFQVFAVVTGVGLQDKRQPMLPERLHDCTGNYLAVAGAPFRAVRWLNELFCLVTFWRYILDSILSLWYCQKPALHQLLLLRFLLLLLPVVHLPATVWCRRLP